MTDSELAVEPQTGGSAKKQPTISYQGRVAKRSDSRERRRRILEATLRIIARDGIRGVRHRAVAQEADVPLAATTYYFKDIDDLITDAFNLFAENTLASTRQLEESSFGALRSLSAEELESAEVRQLLVDALTDFVVQHIEEQVGDRDMRLLESAFRHESLRNPKLAQIARLPRQQMLQTITDFFTLLASPDPEANAHLVMAIILHLEYEALIDGLNRALARRAVHRLIEPMVQNTAATDG